MRALAFSGGKDSLACLHLMRDSLDFAIYVCTGKAYPETLALVDYARSILTVHVVDTDREGQNEREGIPADVVPIDWTRLGQLLTGPKSVKVQSYLGCCYENISGPLFAAAKSLGVTELVSGQRNDEGRKALTRDGDVVDGIARLHPIEGWPDAEVLAYLASKMEVPKHFHIKHSSLDCYDCTAYRKDSADRVEWTKRHPDLYAVYLKRKQQLDAALGIALDEQVSSDDRARLPVERSRIVVGAC